ncbi:hypothetical protein N7V09_17985 [Shewanella seohaensis]|uniref:hypothetical protein n=1 Tax=Shewanella seohaensis TaxID=755175 RepID=UPI00200BFDFC|nr:hypothetical protein [Shewanella seohaensis]MCL1120307.1 hypothetical protein [Shewanella seohaensis]UXM81585.1 hypothetical protein N7V09_17985 [Shewanella seohaensis]
MENSVCYQEEFFEDEKDYFLSKLVKLPDCFIRASSLDHMDRFLEIFSYPFSGEKLRSNIGCYFFFDSYRLDGDVVDFAPLYVGKTKQLNKRLYRHWKTSGNHIDKYSEDVLFQDGEYEIDLGYIGEYHLGKLIPSFDIKIAIWLENDLRELMFLEHELIYKLRPMFNKA